MTPAELVSVWLPTCSRCAACRARTPTSPPKVAVWAQLHGSDSHGAVHLPLYTRGLLDGTIKARPDFKTTQALPCCAVLDADHGLGLVASERANDMAIDIAKTSRPRRGGGAQVAAISAPPAITPSAPPSRA